MESLWYLRDKEHRHAIGFHPTECRMLAALTVMHEAEKARNHFALPEEPAERAPMVSCSVCGDPTYSAEGLCGSHRGNAGKYPRK